MPDAKTRALSRTRGQAPTNEGAVLAPDVSPPRLPPVRPPIAFVEGRNAGALDSTSKRVARSFVLRLPLHDTATPMTFH